MTLLAHLETRLKQFGVDCSVIGAEVHIVGESRPTKIRLEDGWEEAFGHYKKARSLSFDTDSKTLIHNTSVEFLLIQLAPGGSLADQHILRDSANNTVSVGMASMIYALAFFDSSEYESYFRARIEKRLASFHLHRITRLMWMPKTATYTAKGRKTPPNLKEIGLSTIKNCLFKLAVEEHDCLSIWDPKLKRTRTTNSREHTSDSSIPRASYDENVVSYYKVAKASPFPSQSFLSYYHVLEYHFLRVAEDLLHHRLTSMLNDTKFKTGRDNLDKVIAAVRGQDARSDETEMLRNVLNRYIQESELIEFISMFESDCGEKLYTKKRKVFGEHLEINLREGHALSNAANALKHVRNAIVHSSDRYNRDECHIPLSDSENIVEDYIPLVRFFAEKVIYGTAQ